MRFVYLWLILECDSSCKTCDKNGCLTCEVNAKIESDKCIAIDGYFLEEGSNMPSSKYKIKFRMPFFLQNL